MLKIFKNNIVISNSNYWITLLKIIIITFLLFFSTGFLFSNSFKFNIAGYVILVFSFFLIAIFKIKVFNFKTKIEMKSIFVLFLSLLLLIVIILGIDSLMNYLQINPKNHNNLNRLTVQTIISIIIISPIIEEIIFRAFFISGLFRDYPFTGYIISSLTFSLFHSPENIFVFLIYLIAGLILGLSYFLSRRIEIPILFHLLYNTLMIFLFS